MDEEPTHSPADPDAELMLRLQNGDEKAFDAIVLRWQNPLINFFFRSLKSYERSEDLAQMVFIRIYRASAKYEPRAKFSTFLFQVARHHLINEFRTESRRPMELRDPLDLRGETDDESERMVNELEEAFELALVKLPENQRTAILLLKQQELSYQEIADIMEASEGAVKTWIFRARQFLKQELKDFV